MLQLRSRERRSLIRIFLVAVFIFGGIQLWRRGQSDDIDRFYCGDRGKATLQREPQELLIIGSESLEPANATSTEERDRVLILTPLRDAASHLDQHFKLLSELTYPHQSIDLAFLVSDCKDDTISVLREQLESLQDQSNPDRFRSAIIMQRDFGDTMGQSVEERHGFRAQAPRRMAIGRARNYLLYNAIRPVHDWVYWRDVDIVENPSTILEDFMKHDKDILVPNIWFHRYDKNGKDIEGRYDYNSWQESWWGRWRRSHLDKNVVLAEGYKEYNMHRRTLNWMGDRHKDEGIEVNLDGIGGVNILVKADVHRYGINFPCYPFENQADTEGFAQMARRAGFQVVGLPNYIVWHIDTEEKEGNLKGKPKKDSKI